MKTLNIVGAGKLGRTLARLWTQQGVFKLQDVQTAHAATTEQALIFIGAGRAGISYAEMRSADVWLVATPDARIAQSAAALAASGHLRAGDIVFHCSGALAADELAAAAELGAHIAAVHPVKSFADPAHAVATFAGTWCGVEGAPAALELLIPAFEALDAHIFSIDPATKTLYHAASVMASNYLVALTEAATQCCERAGLERATATQVLEPMMRETLNNVFRLGTADALTGPIARGDSAVVARQFTALTQAAPPLADVYRSLGVIALQLAREQGAAAGDALVAVEQALKARSG